MRRKNSYSKHQYRTWRVYDDVTGLPSTNKKLHKLGKYTGLDNLWTEKTIKPSYGLAPFIGPQEVQADEPIRDLEKTADSYTAITEFDFDVSDPMSTGSQVNWSSSEDYSDDGIGSK